MIVKETCRSTSCPPGYEKHTSLNSRAAVVIRVKSQGLRVKWQEGEEEGGDVEEAEGKAHWYPDEAIDSV